MFLLLIYRFCLSS